MAHDNGKVNHRTIINNLELRVQEHIAATCNGESLKPQGPLRSSCPPIGFAGGDGVSGFDFSLPSRPWLQTKWVVVGLGLPAWVWWLWVWVCRRGCGGYGRLLLIGCRGFGWGVKKNI